MTNHVPKRVFGFVLLLSLSGSAVAEAKLYRWTDAQGNVHYSDQPAANAKEVNPKVPTATPAASKPAVAARSSEDCQRRKDQLQSYRAAAKISETNGLGETHEYSEEQRLRLIESAEQAVRAACDPA